MRRFRFRLQAVLDHAHRLEEAAELALAALAAERQRMQEELGKLERQRRETERELAARQLGRLDLERIRVLRAHLEHTCTRIVEQLLAIQEQEGKMELARAELVARMKRRQVLERLRSEQWSRHRQQEQARESRELDELSSTRYARQALGAGT